MKSAIYQKIELNALEIMIHSTPRRVCRIAAHSPKLSTGGLGGCPPQRAAGAKKFSKSVIPTVQITSTLAIFAVVRALEGGALSSVVVSLFGTRIGGLIGQSHMPNTSISAQSPSRLEHGEFYTFAGVLKTRWSNRSVCRFIVWE